jgi:hypothetical protein
MPTEADRRRDLALRQAIDEYRLMAAEARENAAKSNDESVRSQYLSLAKSLETLIETLQGRQSSQPDEGLR